MNPVAFLAQAPDGALTETRGALRFLSAPEAWVIVLVIVPLAALGVWWIYRREAGRTTPRSRLSLASLRTAILLAVVAILFQPVCMTHTDRLLKQKLVLLVDDSSSMQEHDGYADVNQRQALAGAAGLDNPDRVVDLTRSEVVRRVLGGGNPSLLDRLSERFDTRIYAFDSAVRRNVAVEDLRSQGLSTRMGEALSKVYSELVGQPTAAVVLLSDGRSNEGVDPGRTVVQCLEMHQIQIPLWSVAVGDPTNRSDLAVRVVKPTTGREFLVGDQIPFTVEVRARGFEADSLPVKIEILDASRKLLASQALTLPGGAGSRKEVLYVQAEADGRQAFTIRTPPLEGEADTTNNTRKVVLRIIKKRIKVLFAEGYPRWEYRYLKNALIRDDENFEVHVMLLSAERDFVQEASPDLKPVYAFPAKAADLFHYDVIVLGDVNPANLADTPEETPAVLRTLARFVSEAGGGLLMLAGEGWNPHGYTSTALESVLPVVPGTSAGRTLDFQQPFRPVRTAMGRTDPILIFSRESEENRRLWEDPRDGFPPLYWYASVLRAKPGARVLLTHPTGRNAYGPHPLLATQFYGKGRSMFLGVDSLWRWRKYHGDRFFYQFYSQALRYLATTKLYRGNKRYDLFTDKLRYDIGETVRISAAVRNPDFLPAEEPHQTVYWDAPRTPHSREIQLDKVKPGEYEAVVMAARRGRHTLWIKTHREAEARADETEFEVEITPLEKAEPSMDAVLMRGLADLAGDSGTFHLLHELPAALGSLESRPARTPLKSHTRDIWDSWWVLCLLTGLLALEWAFRKRFRLQ